MTRQEAVAAAIASLLDVVEEIAQGLAHGQEPNREWAEVVADTFKQHRRDLDEAE